jgi:hypothetical protein
MKQAARDWRNRKEFDKGKPKTEQARSVHKGLLDLQESGQLSGLKIPSEKTLEAWFREDDKLN